MKRTLAILLSVTAAVSTQAANIGWVSFHGGDNSPSAAAAATNFVQAPDVGYTALLAANGHTVTRILTKHDPTPADSAIYNSYDVIILSRSVGSDRFQQNNEADFWNESVTAPVISLGGYINRNSRLGFMTGGNIPDTAGNISLAVANPSHPIFSGITLDGANIMVNSFAGIATHPDNGIPQRGISVVTDPVAGGGTVLATVATPGDPAVNGTIIAEWQAGAILANATASQLSGPRLVFLTGSREHGGLTSEGSGIFDLTADGQAMFLNAVNYMATIPEPSTYALLGIGALALIFRIRRKA